MQIHDLNTKALTDPAYVAFDDGTDTYKTEFNQCVEDAAAAAAAEALKTIDVSDNTVAFTSDDATSPTAWSDMSLLSSGLSLKNLFNRLSTAAKNIRWLYSQLGTTDISSIGNGTVKGAISTLNGNSQFKDVSSEFIGCNHGSVLHAIANDHVVYLYAKASAGTKDQEAIITIPNKYKSVTGWHVPLTTFYMNNEDASKLCSATAIGGVVQFRCTSTITGSSGVMVGGSWVYA